MFYLLASTLVDVLVNMITTLRRPSYYLITLLLLLIIISLQFRKDQNNTSCLLGASETTFQDI